MKNQYCGDIRDLFKYDLVQEIMINIKSLEKFTFIPMLTPNDTKKDGSNRDFDKARAGYGNNELKRFLERCHAKRDFREISSYYKSLKINTCIYNHINKDDYFENRSRVEYFKNVGRNILQNALILFDPDNGLEVKNNTRKHVLYEDVRGVFKRMNEKSIIMIFQFFPRKKRDVYIKYRISELSNEITENITYISDNTVIFFFLTKEKRLLEESLKNTLRAYNNIYPKLIMGY